MADRASAQVIDLIFGRWRSQILHAGTALGVFDHLAMDRSTNAPTVAAKIGADPALLYRLLRALAAIGLLAEDDGAAFRLTEAGSVLRADHPQSLRAMALLEEGKEHYAIWTHLVAMLRDGRQNGFVREFGVMAFEHAKRDAQYDSVFNQAMSSYSAVQTQWTLAALADEDFTSCRTLCDVAGGHGHLICGFLQRYRHLHGIVLDLPGVVADTDRLWAAKMGLEARCRYVAGDMFQQVPSADAYLLKMILHDWNDEECVRILENLRRAVTDEGRVFVVEHVIPGPGNPHFAKLFDIHMMCWGSGRERTAVEYGQLLAAADWRHVATHRPPDALVGVVVASAA